MVLSFHGPQVNARTELERMVGALQVKYGRIVIGKSYADPPIRLEVRFYNHGEYLAMLPALNVEYDDGWGGQWLFGIVVFSDGTWLERGEYDGSEWWEHKQLPTQESVFSADWPS